MCGEPVTATAIPRGSVFNEISNELALPSVDQL